MNSIFKLLILIAFITISNSCPDGYYSDTSYKHCVQCQYPCLICLNSTTCTSYASGYNSSGYAQCYSPSSTNLYYDSSKDVCRRRCATGCTACSNGDYSYCTSCQTGYFRIGQTCTSLGDLTIVCMVFIIAIFLMQAGLLVWCCIRGKTRKVGLLQN